MLLRTNWRDVKHFINAHKENYDNILSANITPRLQLEDEVQRIDDKPAPAILGMTENYANPIIETNFG
jgi:hypothetical protein